VNSFSPNTWWWASIWATPYSATRGCCSAEKSSNVSANLTVIEDFCSRLEVLPYICRAKVAHHYGAICATLAKSGKQIGVNDLHIAAHARSEGLIVVINNVQEFMRVPALQVENWVG